MFDLSSETFCNSLSDITTLPPLVRGFEFMPRMAPLKTETQVDFQQIARMCKQGNWDFDLLKIRDFIKVSAHALVVTDGVERIQWVNQGFVSMTGYNSQEALRKSPKFLQGDKTSSTTRQNIRTKISEQVAFNGTILNYRKNGEPYWCNVSIEPIFNRSRELVNYIAFECEVRKSF
ncbi:MAG: PAS domain-containing protein [Runella slithyformis]|nr:MAG: PAS domain-containing protein [Runella slithyformis]TAF44078.1 MAG: PAS domain-containing protein [Runella slithyformis]TAG21066.1 MAG: PAS domain-containing protein [Cytophagales bacterium]TAG40436.1 MAG: PAS domain-containing protein [Cytophagia bacterium]TAG81963.1 MAG: PAS domain-containing protein [Cytophagales bacterium]